MIENWLCICPSTSVFTYINIAILRSYVSQDLKAPLQHTPPIYHPYQSLTSARNVSRKGFLWFNQIVANISRTRTTFQLIKKFSGFFPTLKVVHFFIWSTDNWHGIRMIPRFLPVKVWVHSPQNKYPWFTALFYFLAYEATPYFLT